MKHLSLEEQISKMEYEIAKYKFVMEKFPDATIYGKDYDYSLKRYITTFKSKNVNLNYTNYDFSSYYRWLDLRPYCELKFEYNDKSEIIKIVSSPAKIKLCNVKATKIEFGKYERTIVFSTFFKRYKVNKFNDKFLNDCRIKILDFIKTNSDCKLDTKNIDPRIKKLLIFS